MRKLFMAFLTLSACAASAQLTTLPSGGDKKATVTERIGLTDVSIQYSRPHVNGREGKIWGTLVPVGFVNLGFGSATSSPWRAGANENTVISFSNAVNVEGQELAAGTYGLFIAYDPAECTIIFSKNSTSWGSFYYNDKEDVLRVKTKPAATEQANEWLKYEFAEQTDSTATIDLVWEKLRIPFKVTTHLAEDQVNSFRKELRSDKGFTWITWNQAAQWCAAKNTNLGQALQWADSAISPTFGGNTQFAPYGTKAQILNLMGRTDEAATLMKQAMPFGSMFDLHQYARQLLTAKKTKEALEIFKLNASKHPGEFTTLVGLARGYSATGDYKTALKYAQQALPIAPDPLNKGSIETGIGKLKEGKDMN